MNEPDHQPAITHAPMHRPQPDSAAVCADSAAGRVDIALRESEERFRALQTLRDDLQQRVESRTAGLAAANAALKSEIIRRKQTEEALRRSEECFSLAMRGTDAGIWDWSLTTGEVYYSPRWKSMLGYKPAEIDNSLDQWHGRLHPSDRRPFQAAVRDYLDQKSSQYDSEFRLRHKDGSYR